MKNDYNIVLSIIAKTFGERRANIIICLVLMAFGIKNSEIKNKFGISYDALRKYRKALDEGNVEDLLVNNGYRAKSELEPYADIIKENFDSNPPKTLREAQDRIEKITGIKRSLNRICVFLKKRASNPEQ